MAQRTEVYLIDDVDGSPATSTVSFALDGVSYAIDLSEANAADLRAALASWIARARRTDGRRGGRPRGRKSDGDGETAAIRIWARQQGEKVSERGRIPAKIREAYANR